MKPLILILAVLALSGCAAERTVRDVTVGADAVHLACSEAVPVAQMAVLIPGAGAIAQGVVVGCQTADGLARLAAEPTSAAWLGEQTQMLKDLIARTRTRLRAKDLSGVLPVLRIPGA